MKFWKRPPSSANVTLASFDLKKKKKKKMLTGYPEFLLMRHTRVSGTAAWYRVRASWKFLVFVRRLQATRVFSRGSVWIYQNFQEWHQRPSWGVKIRMLMRRARQSPRGWSNNTSCHCTRFLFFFRHSWDFHKILTGALLSPRFRLLWSFPSFDCPKYMTSTGSSKWS